MKKQLRLTSILSLPLFLMACDVQNTSVAIAEPPADRMADCLDLGFAPDSFEMQKCLETESRVQRLVLADQETYGTF